MAFFLFFTILSLIASVACGPVEVRIEQDNNKSFYVGPQARTTFELIEEYHPLSTAFNQQNRPRAHASSLSKGPVRRTDPSPVQILVDFAGGDENAPEKNAGRSRNNRILSINNATPTGTVSDDENGTKLKSHWLEWTRWSACANGERIRIRQCLEVNGVRCEGENVQRQNCFHFQSQVPVAKDPLVIEKEILGIDDPLRSRRH